MFLPYTSLPASFVIVSTYTPISEMNELDSSFEGHLNSSFPRSSHCPLNSLSTFQLEIKDLSIAKLLLC